MKNALEIENLKVAHSNKIVLKDINFNLADGAFIAVVGANGAGKSTLIKSICGLEKYAGKIKVFGKDLKKVNKNIIGYLPQNNTSEKNCPVTVFEAVSIGRFSKKGILKKFSFRDSKIVENCLKTAGISKLKDISVGKISGGEAQKVAIARILAQQPKIILLDEPQANLDPKSQKEFLALIEKLYKKYKFTCVMVTHDIGLIPKYCQKVIMLKKGQLIDIIENKNIKAKVKKLKLYNQE